MARVLFSRHALLRMRRRKIPAKLIVKTVVNPDVLTSQPAGTHVAAKLFRRERKPYALVVIYRDQHTAKHIVTAFFSSKVRKYLGKNL